MSTRVRTHKQVGATRGKQSVLRKRDGLFYRASRCAVMTGCPAFTGIIVVIPKLVQG